MIIANIDINQNRPGILTKPPPLEQHPDYLEKSFKN
jgi:hypothetical protein